MEQNKEDNDNNNNIFNINSNVKDENPCNKVENHTKYDSLACWLWKLNVALPDQTFHDGIFSLSIQSMQCSNFSINSLKAISSSSINNSTKNPSINVSVSDFSSSCSGTYVSGLMGGSVFATLTSLPDTPMHMNMNLISNITQDGYKTAAGIYIPSCQSDVTIPTNQLIFSGSISAYFINLFSNHISSWISSSLSSQICPIAVPQLELHLNQTLGRINEYMLELIHNFTNVSSSAPSSYLWEDGSDKITNNDLESFNLKDNGQFVTWEKDLVFVSKMLNQSNQFLSHYLNEGILTDLATPNNGGYVSSCNNGFFSNGVNGYLQNVTNGSVFYSLPSLINYTKIIPLYGNITLRLHNMSLEGIDQFENLTLFQPKNENTLLNKMKSDPGVNVSLGCSIRVDPINGGSVQGDSLEESFELRVELSNVDILSQVDLAIKRYHLGKLFVGNIISFPSPGQFDIHLPCLASILDSIHWTNIQARLNLNHITFYSLDDNSTTDDRQLERDLDATIETIVNLFIEEYTPFVSDAILGFSHGPLNTIFNYASSLLLYDLTHDSSGNYISCTTYKPNNDSSNNDDDEDDNYFHLDESIIPSWINNVLFGNNSIATVNQWMECTEEVIKQINPMKNIYSFQVGHLNVDLRGLMLANYDTFSSFDILQPEIDHYHLLNQFILGQQQHQNASKDISSSFWLTLQDDSTINGFIANVYFNISFSDLYATTGTAIKYDKNLFSSLPISTFMNHSQCMYAPASSEFQLYDTNSTISITQVDMSLDIIWSNAIQNKSIYNSTWNISGVGAVTNFVNSLFSFIIPFGMQRTDKYVHNNIAYGLDVCYNDSQSDGFSTVTQMFFGFILMFHVLMFIVFLIMYVKKKQNSEKLDPRFSQPLLCSNESDKADVAANSIAEDETNVDSVKTLDLNEFMEGIGEDLLAIDEEPNHTSTLLKKIPISSSLFIMFSIIFTTILFISSNASIGASIDMVFSSAYGTTRKIPSISTFSLVDSVQEMCQAGVYFLFVIVLFFSGIWPYIKLFLMTFACVATPNYLSTNNRGRLLVTLDALGKYSLVDSFFLIITIVAFRFHLEWINIGSFDVFVSTKYGGYSFIIATIMSLIIGHYILYKHRHVTDAWVADNNNDNEALKETLITEIINKYCKRATFLWILEFLLILFCFYTAAFLIIGVSANTFTIEIKGLAGYLLQEHSLTEYSILSLGKSIVFNTGDNTSGAYFLAAIFFFFVVVMPFTCLFLSIVLLFTRIGKHQQFLLVSAEIAYAWSALDVFVLSMAAAVLQISQFASFMIGDRCDGINGILKIFLDDANDVDDICYDIRASLKSSAFFLIIGVVLHLSLTNFIMGCCRSIIKEKKSEQPKGYYALLEAESDDGFQDIEEEFLLYRN